MAEDMLLSYDSGKQATHHGYQKKVRDEGTGLASSQSSKEPHLMKGSCCSQYKNAASKKAKCSPSERLWLEMYHSLARCGISLNVLLDCLEILEIAEQLVSCRIVTRTQLDSLVEKSRAGDSDANRHLFDIVVHKKAMYRKRFIEILQNGQVHIWYFSQLHWTGVKPLSTASSSEWKFKQTVLPKLWLWNLELKLVLDELRNEGLLSELQHREMVALMLVQPKRAVEERLVCVFQWKSVEIHTMLKSVLKSLYKGQQQRNESEEDEPPQGTNQPPSDRTNGQPPKHTGHFPTNHAHGQRSHQQASVLVETCPIPLLYGAKAVRMALRQMQRTSKTTAEAPLPGIVEPYVTTAPCSTPWTVLYDVLRLRGLSLVVVVDCIDTMVVAEMLYERGVLSPVEFSCIQQVKNPNDVYIKHWLINAITKKSRYSQEVFTAVLLHHQPYLVKLSNSHWCGPEPFSSTCGHYWSLQDGYIHKGSLCEVHLPDFLPLLMKKKLLSISEYHELMALREKLQPWDVNRRLVCLFMWKPVGNQNIFVGMLDNVVHELAAKIIKERFQKTGKQEKESVLSMGTSPRKGDKSSKERMRSGSRRDEQQIVSKRNTPKEKPGHSTTRRRAQKDDEQKQTDAAFRANGTRHSTDDLTGPDGSSFDRACQEICPAREAADKQTTDDEQLVSEVGVATESLPPSSGDAPLDKTVPKNSGILSPEPETSCVGENGQRACEQLSAQESVEVSDREASKNGCAVWLREAELHSGDTARVTAVERDESSGTMAALSALSKDCSIHLSRLRAADQESEHLPAERVSNLTADVTCNVKSWIALYDSLKQVGLPLTVVIDNMITPIAADLLVDCSVLQMRVYQFISFPCDVRPDQLNRFLINKVSEEGLAVRQKFVKCLMKFQPSLFSAVRSKEEDGNQEGLLPRCDPLYGALAQAISDSGMKNVLDELGDSDALSALERCELLTQLEREDQDEVNSRLVAMIRKLPYEAKKMCHTILTALSDDATNLFEPSNLSECLASFSITMEKAVQFMDPVPVLEQLHSEGVLLAGEVNVIRAASHRKPRYKVNSSLLKLMLQKSVAHQSRFCEVLSDCLPSLTRDQQEKLDEDLLDVDSERTNPSTQPSVNLLLDIAEAIPDVATCTKLAAALDIGGYAVDKVSKSQFTDILAFAQVLSKWRQMKGSGATRQVLYDALLEIGRRDLADDFRGQLLSDSTRTDDQPVGASDANEPTVSRDKEIFQDYTEQLQLWYRDLTSVRLIDSMPIGEKEAVGKVYVTLSSLSYMQAQQLMGEQQELSFEDIDHFSRDSSADKMSTELDNLEDLLKTSDGKMVQRALVIGPGGSGKSLTCSKIIADWIDRTAFRQFLAVVHISAKDTDHWQARSSSDLLCLDSHGYSQSQQTRLLLQLRKRSEKLLFLIDGSDEAAGEGLLTPGTALHDVLNRKLFRNASVIITTRPSPSCYNLLNICDKCFYLAGFTEKHLNEFVRNRLEPSEASNMLQRLNDVEFLHIKSLIKRTPLFAAMVTQLFSKCKILPESITDLFQKMLRELCWRLQYKKNPSAGEGFGLYSPVDDPSEKMVEVRELQGLAVHGLLNHTFMFPANDVARRCCQSACKLGLITEVLKIKVGSRQRAYTFCHLMWLEFLAAKLLATDEDICQQISICVDSLGVREHTWQFWQFLAAFLVPSRLPELIFQLVSAQVAKSQRRCSQKFKCFLTKCVAESLVCQSHLVAEYMDIAMVTIWGDSLFYLCDYDLTLSESKAIGLTLNKCTSLTTVLIENSLLGAQHFQLISPGLAHISTAVQLSAVGGLDQTAMESLLAHAQNCPTVALQSCRLHEGSCAALSKRFCGLSVQRLEIKDCGLTAGMLQSMATAMASQQWPSLRSLQFIGGNLQQSGLSLKSMIIALPRLEEISVQNCQLHDSDLSPVLQELLSIRTLHQATLCGNFLTEGILPQMQNAIQQRKDSGVLNGLLIEVGGNAKLPAASLRQIKFPANSGVAVIHGVTFAEDNQSGDLNVILELIDNIRDRECYMPHWAGDSGAHQIAQFLQADTELRTCRFNGSYIGNKGAAALAEALLMNNTLEVLDLSDNEISMEGWKALSTALLQNNAMVVVNLRGNPIYTGYNSTLCGKPYQHSHCMSVLKVLCLSDTGMNDESLENWSPLLFQVLQLSTLDLSHNAISDQGVFCLQKYLSLETFVLSTLSLSHNNITGIGAEALASSLQSVSATSPNHSLKSVILGHNRGIPRTFFSRCECAVISSVSLTIQSTRSIFYLARMVGANLGVDVRSILPENSKVTNMTDSLPASRSLVMFMKRLTENNEMQECRRWLRRYLTVMESTAPPLDNVTATTIFYKGFVMMLVKSQPVFSQAGTTFSVILCALACFFEKLQASGEVSADQGLSMLLQIVHARLQNCAKQQVAAWLDEYRRRYLSLAPSQIVSDLCRQILEYLSP